MSKGFCIVMYSGTADTFMSMGVLSQISANLGVPVRIYVTGFALLYFTKNKPEPRFPKEFEDFAPKMIKGMKRANVPDWYDMLKEAKELGDVKVYGCSTTASIMGLKKEDFDPIVDDIVGATTFLNETAGYEIVFI